VVAVKALNLFLKDYRAIALSLRAELPTLRAALTFARPHMSVIKPQKASTHEKA
jgi:hypothetical protein